MTAEATRTKRQRWMLVGLLVVVAAAAPSLQQLLVDWVTPESSPPPGPPEDPVPLVQGLGTWAVHTTLPGLVTTLRGVSGGGAGLVATLRDGRIFWVLPDGNHEQIGSLADEVRTVGGEQGLLDLVVDPADPLHVVVHYSDADGATVIERWRLEVPLPDGLRGRTPAREEILRVAQPYSNHNGGQLQFGPDGLLYLGLGDGGAGGDPENRAQNPQELLGKLLRLDVRGPTGYTPAPPSPGAGADWLPEIYAIGLRNPWRFAWDVERQHLWVADVGQNRWEEVHLLTPTTPGPLNLGWKVMEGDRCYPSNEPCAPAGMVPPVHVYSHDDGCSITGGVVVPTGDLAHTFLFGDFCSGFIHGLRVDETTGQVVHTPLWRTNLGITTFGTDDTGQVYVASSDGRVLRML